MVMNEDQDRNRIGNAPHNFAVLRHMALNIVQKDGEKGSLRGKIKKAGWDEAYLVRLLSLNRNAIALVWGLQCQARKSFAHPHLWQTPIPSARVSSPTSGGTLLSRTTIPHAGEEFRAAVPL